STGRSSHARKVAADGAVGCGCVSDGSAVDLPQASGAGPATGSGTGAQAGALAPLLPVARVEACDGGYVRRVGHRSAQRELAGAATLGGSDHPPSSARARRALAATSDAE